KPKPKPKQEEEIVIRRRVIEEPPPEPVRKERVKKRPVVDLKPKEPEPPKEKKEFVFRPRREPMEDPLKRLEEDRKRREEEEKKRIKERMRNKILKEEGAVDQIRLKIRKKCREMKFETPPPYVPVDPVEKSQKL
ncbi:hypothetical protein DD587_32485, partial [Klebsiella pneumoniae]